MSQSDLRAVARKVTQLRRTEQELADAILKAHAAGESYRDIASFAGMPYSRVYRLAVERRKEVDPFG